MQGCDASPPRFGGCRIALLQLKSSSQLAIESELETTLPSTEDRCDAQEPRADYYYYYYYYYYYTLSTF